MVPIVIDGYIPPQTVAHLRAAAVEYRHLARMVDTLASPGVTPECPPAVSRHYSVMDGHLVDELLPELFGMYIDHIVPLASLLVGVPLLCGEPTSRGTVNIKWYPAGRGHTSPHFDANPYTALLYLAGGGPTVFGNGEFVIPRPGRLVVFNGRENLHWSVLGIKEKQVIVFNLFTAGCPGWPAEADSILFGDDPLQVAA